MAVGRFSVGVDFVFVSRLEPIFGAVRVVRRLVLRVGRLVRRILS